MLRQDQLFKGWTLGNSASPLAASEARLPGGIIRLCVYGGEQFINAILDASRNWRHRSEINVP